jgi:hypothetical protein
LTNKNFSDFNEEMNDLDLNIKKFYLKMRYTNDYLKNNNIQVWENFMDNKISKRGNVFNLLYNLGEKINFKSNKSFVVSKEIPIQDLVELNLQKLKI